MRSSKWFLAQLNLFYRGFLHVLRKFKFWDRKSGRDEFLNNYLADGLPPYTPEHRAMAHEPGRCTTCALCDVHCPKLADGTDADFIGPMRLVIAGVRGGPSIRHVRHTLEVMTDVTCDACRACEKACPENIPILTLSSHFLAQERLIRLS